MKNFRLIKTAIVLFAALAFSNCEDGEPIQFIVVDEVPTEIAVQGFDGLSEYSTSSVADLSDLLDSATTFIEADIEKVTLSLKDYSEASITGTIKITVGGVDLINEAVTLSNTAVSFTIPPVNSDVLSSINSGFMTITMEGTTATPIADNDFVIVVTPTVRGLI
jgi:hypothetical protein